MKNVEDLLLAFASGDAMGMPTEFMTRDAIRSEIGKIGALLESSQSQNHSNLPKGSVTDDTEQVVYLLKAYMEKGVTPESSVEALLGWIEETGAVEKRYIGPSSLKALTSVKAGTPPEKAGLGGTTCGGIMRTPAPVLYGILHGEALEVVYANVRSALLATHNTSQALEAAYAYAAALYSAWEGKDRSGIVEAAMSGCSAGRASAPYVAASSGTLERLRFLTSWPGLLSMSDDEFADFLYGVIGTGLESADVAAAVFAVFLRYGHSVYSSICHAAELGGDTDTIAALAGALAYAYTGKLDVPKGILSEIVSVNNLDFSFLGRDKSE